MADLKFVKNLKKRHKLVPLMEHIIRDPKALEGFVFEYEAKRSDDAFHPSGDCDVSVADLVHKIKGTVEEKDWSGMEKTFMVGHFWHAFLQHVLVYGDLAPVDAIERKYSIKWGDNPYQWGTGAADVAPCVLPTHGDYLVDFKTMSSHQYKGQDVPAWAAVKYEAQLSVYMEWHDLDHALIVAINKDGPHDMKEFEYERNTELAEAVFDKWQLAGEIAYDGIELHPDAEVELDLAQWCKGPVSQ